MAIQNITVSPNKVARGKKITFKVKFASGTLLQDKNYTLSLYEGEKLLPENQIDRISLGCDIPEYEWDTSDQKPGVYSVSATYDNEVGSGATGESGPAAEPSARARARATAAETNQHQKQ